MTPDEQPAEPPIEHYVGELGYHYVVGRSFNEGTGQECPSYEVHAPDHECRAHFHDEWRAVEYCAMVTALTRHGLI